MNATLPAPKHDSQRIEGLVRAFDQFNEMSRQLQSSWSALEARVAELTRERDDAREARLAELAAREQATARLQALLAALPAAALMIDADGIVREHNVGALELLGQPLVGQTWRDVAMRALRARSDTDGTPCLADGRHLAVSRRTTAEGGCVLLLTDDSEAHARRHGVAEQRQCTDRDEQQARLAHQLRTPLATAVLYVSRIADGGMDAPAAHRMAGKALARLVDLQQLIDQTLALARGTSNRSACVPVGELLRDAVANLASRGHAQPRIDVVDAGADAILRGQRRLLESVLVNLLDNAAVFAARVRLEATREDANVLIAVHDDGPGIDADAARHVFEPFFTTRPGGTGLGLAMARTIARAHGGDLQLVASDHGARFELRLPLDGHATPMPSDIHARHAAATSGHQRQGTSP